MVTRRMGTTGIHPELHSRTHTRVMASEEGVSFLTEISPASLHLCLRTGGVVCSPSKMGPAAGNRRLAVGPFLRQKLSIRIVREMAAYRATHVLSKVI